MEWTQQFEIIKNKFLIQEAKKPSVGNLADFLGVSRGKPQAWGKGQRPSADDLETIARKLGFSPAWLLLGEGEPEPTNPAKAQLKDAYGRDPNQDSKPSAWTANNAPIARAVAEIECAMRRINLDDKAIWQAIQSMAKAKLGG